MRGAVLSAFGLALAGGTLSAEAAGGGPSLGAARGFAVLAAANVTNTGLSAVVGDVGVSPGTEITGFPPATVTGGSIHAGDATAALAHSDASLAYAFLDGMPGKAANNLTGQDLGGLRLKPGVYTFNSSAELTGSLTLDARGDSRALFVFQIESSLTTASGASVVVVNGGGNYDESRVFWQVGSSATLGLGTDFKGIVIAYASVTLTTGSTLVGSAIALNGAVTMDATDITSPLGGSGTKPSGRKTKLTPPDGAADRNAIARLNVRHFPAKRASPERSWFKLKLRRLDRSTNFTLWSDDPSTVATDLVQFESFTTNPGGKFNYLRDTKKTDAMPFGATLPTLGGSILEVRDAAGTTVILSGTIPTTLQ